MHLYGLTPLRARPVAFDQAKTQRGLEALLTRRAGDKAVDEFQAS